MSGWSPSDEPGPADGSPGFATALRGGVARRARRPRDADEPSRWRRAVPTRDAWVDAAFAAALVTIALVGLRTGFLGPQWMVAAAVGLVLGLVVGHLAAVFQWLAVTTLVVLTATYFLLGGPVAVRTDLVAGVLPTGQTLVDLATWAVTGWKKWLTLLPPVDARGPVLALPWLAGLLGGAVTLGRRPALGVGAAHRRRAAACCSPARSPSAPWSRRRCWCRASGSPRCSSAGWSCGPTARARRCRAGPGARPGSPPGRCSWRSPSARACSPARWLPGTSADDRREVVRTALVPPLDVSQFPSPLPGFRRYTEPNTAALYDKVVLRVDGLPPGALVRFATLDDYDGLVWGAADRSTDGVPFQQVGSRIAPSGAGTPVDVTVDVVDGGYSGYWLPTVGAPTRIEFDGPRSDELGSELWLNTDTDTAVVPRRLLGGERYTMSALLPAAPAAELPEDLDVAGGASSSQDLDVLDSRIDAWTSRAEGAWGKLRAVAGQMRTEGTYTDGGTPNSFEKVYLPGHATARLEPVRQLHQARRQRRAVRRHPGAGRAAARHPVAGRHGCRAGGER